MDQYEVLGKIGEGAFGVVLRAQRISDQLIVAIKKVRLRRLDEGLPKEAFREVQALQLLNHPNVVRLHAVFPHGSSIAIVCEFAKADLQNVMRNVGRPLSEVEIKTIAWLAIQGIAHCHENQLLHRDIKPANLLLGHDGQVMLADFGLARVIEPPGRCYSLHAATRWYRAPELLFGAKQYSAAIDVWSMGSTFGEMLNGSAIWQGENDIDQLSRMQVSLGTFSTETWPQFDQLPDFGKINFREMEAEPLRNLSPNASPLALGVLVGMLCPDPAQRFTTEQLLQHDFFFSDPLPAHKSVLQQTLIAEYVKQQESKDQAEKAQQGKKRTAQIADMLKFN